MRMIKYENGKVLKAIRTDYYGRVVGWLDITRENAE